jgi:HlyD family secretion protein
MKKRAPIIILILLIIAAIIVYASISRNQGNRNSLMVSGNIEVTDAQLGFKIPGRLAERLVDEGRPVTSGQVIARLESTDQELAVAAAEANVRLAQSTLDELLAGSRPQDISRAAAQVEQARAGLDQLLSGSRTQEIADAQAALDRAQAALQAAQTQLDLARSDYDRYTSLYDEGVVSASEYDRMRTQFELAQSGVEQAQAQVTSAEEKLSLVQVGPRPEQIEQARAMLGQAQAGYDLVLEGPRTETIQQAQARLDIANEALAQARQMLEYTQLKAPFDGIVMSKAAEPGEYLNPGSPVVTIADLATVYLRAYINETDLGRIALGQNVQVRTDSYPGKVYQGVISYISNQAEFTPKSVQTLEERVKLVYLIKVELANPNQELKPGMPADCVIELGK